MRCPHCEHEAESPEDAIEHMNERHPDVAAQRLDEPGVARDERSGQWADTRTPED